MVRAITRYLKRRRLREIEEFLGQLEDQVRSGEAAIENYSVKAARLRGELIALENPRALIEEARA